ncbi:hypothetical protein ACFQ3H_11990, partial [Paralysiella testudinis]
PCNMLAISRSLLIGVMILHKIQGLNSGNNDRNFSCVKEFPLQLVGEKDKTKITNIAGKQ